MSPTLTEVLAQGHWRPDVGLVLASFGVAYITGWRQLRRRRPAVARAGQLGFYLLGLSVIVLALLSPIDALAAWLLTMHMLQHELLTMVAPPLLLLANPLPVILWGVPRRVRHRLGRLLTRGALVREGLRMLTRMPVAWVLYMVTLWSWHLPAAYEASLRNEIVHNAQHLSFFATGLLFWWPLVNPAPRLHGHIPYGFRLVYIIAAVGPTALPIMAIAVFAREVFYPHYTTVPRLWGLSALEDQAVGWGLMGALDGLIYLIALLLLVARMLEHEEQMTRLREAIDLKSRGSRS
ncbi:MAG: cytochrome c oxidase assembly protein [Candidatus Rokubacteria bacterium]|nr:cytochrome c oxidase assembly protein [Candidatus Rokubacteria bacterium]